MCVVKSTVGKVIHPELGAIELARKPSGGDGFIVLSVIPKRGEFVSWWINNIEDLICSGHYTRDLDSAWRDFNDRY